MLKLASTNDVNSKCQIEWWLIVQGTSNYKTVYNTYYTQLCILQSPPCIKLTSLSIGNHTGMVVAPAFLFIIAW